MHLTLDQNRFSRNSREKINSLSTAEDEENEVAVVAKLPFHKC
jgi:Tfp pilus assembly protein PilX